MYKKEEIEAELDAIKEARRVKWVAKKKATDTRTIRALEADIAFNDGYIMALERAVGGGLFFANQHKQDKAALV